MVTVHGFLMMECWNVGVMGECLLSPLRRMERYTQPSSGRQPLILHESLGQYSNIPLFQFSSEGREELRYQSKITFGTSLREQLQLMLLNRICHNNQKILKSIMLQIMSDLTIVLGRINLLL